MTQVGREKSNRRKNQDVVPDSDAMDFDATSGEIIYAQYNDISNKTIFY